MALRSYLRKGMMEVLDAELWAIWIALKETAKRAEGLRLQGVQKVTIFSGSQAAVQRAAHLEIGPGQQFARWINNEARVLRIVASKQKFAGSLGTQASLETKRQIHKQMQLAKTAVAQSESRPSPLQRIEQEGSPSEE
jgi:hypothetical protein